MPDFPVLNGPNFLSRVSGWRQAELSRNKLPLTVGKCVLGLFLRTRKIFCQGGAKSEN